MFIGKTKSLSLPSLLYYTDILQIGTQSVASRRQPQIVKKKNGS